MQGMSMFFKLEYLYFTSVLSWILSENICHIQCQVPAAAAHIAV